jgi:SAM-dependent methyltransferase
MTDLFSRAHIIKYHNDSIKKFGVDSKEAIGWKDRSNQLARFEALCSLLSLENHSVLDIGCATGDLLEFINSKNIKCDYTGIDQIKDFIEFAGNKFNGQKNVSFLLGDFWSADLGTYDFVVASGALSYRNSDPHFIYNMVAKLYGLCKISFAFNLLEDVELKGGGLVAYNKKEIVEFCKKLSPRVVLYDGYLEGDFTVSISKFRPLD